MKPQHKSTQSLRALLLVFDLLEEESFRADGIYGHILLSTLSGQEIAWT
jgi:hypothetical protein